MQRLTPARLFRVAAIAIASSCGIGIPWVGAQSPTAEQIEIFQNLPPDQQRAILEAMGSGSRTDRDQTDTGPTTPTTVQPKPDLEQADRLRPRELRLAAGDTVIVEFELVEWVGQNRVLTEKPTVQLTPAMLLPSAAGATQTVPPSTAQPGAAPRSERPADARPVDRTDQQVAQLTQRMQMLHRANPYRLTRIGTIELPGVGPMLIAGLTTYEATQRLTVEPLLRDFRIRLTFLPVERADSAGLTRFGYDLFAGVPTTYAPVTDIPVPADYVVGPGDRFEVQLIGNTKDEHRLTVTREGNLMLPDLGPIPISGLRFPEARERIQQRVADRMIGTQAVVSMADIRSIRVFVLGETERPGSYTVSGLSTITNALFASGGVKEIGSLRKIQLKRGGTLVKQLDLYDLLLNGDTSGDVRLQPGDVIFIPPVGSTVGVAGEIRRPAIYELRGAASTADLLQLGGGLTPEADPALAYLERIDDRRERIIVGVDLNTPQGLGAALRSGDLLRIDGVKPTYANSIQLEGHVARPTALQYRTGIRLTDAIVSPMDLKANADQGYVVIRREQPGSRRIEVVSADLAAAWAAPGSDANPLLAPRDRIVVFDREAGRGPLLDPILDELRLQAANSRPSQIVRVSGSVRSPGEYPLEPGMTVSDLIRAGGGLSEDAFGGEADLARYEVQDGQTRKTDVIKINLAQAVAGEGGMDLTLAPFDFLVIKEVSQWAAAQETVRIEGEVKFPGEYPIERGETLRSLIARAGGLSPLAFPGGSVFTRESLRVREQEQIRILANRLQQDLGALALQGAQAGPLGANQSAETLTVGRSLLEDLRNTEPVGRLVIDLDRIMAGTGDQGDVILKNGDTLRVPQMAQEVTVIGEVQTATSHLYDSQLTRDDYIQLSGGTTQKADDKRIYVVRANGSVVSGSGSGWFNRSADVQPGDTIVVPLDAERMRPLALWTAVTTIIYNLAVAVAAVGSF